MSQGYLSPFSRTFTNRYFEIMLTVIRRDIWYLKATVLSRHVLLRGTTLIKLLKPSLSSQKAKLRRA